jgi:hypothetical protein
VWRQGSVAFRALPPQGCDTRPNILGAVREYGDRVPDVYRTLRRAQEATEQAHRARLEAQLALERSQELRARLAELEGELRRPLRAE